MALFTGGVFPAGGEVGDGGGVLQVTSGFRTGEFSFSQSSHAVYQNILVVAITPTRNDSKILVFGSADGIACRGSSHAEEWEGWLAYNPNNTTNGGSPTGWHTSLGMITGLGAWGGFGQATVGSIGFNFLHSPNTTSQVHYALIANRRKISRYNNEYGSHNGTSLICMEISS